LDDRKAEAIGALVDILGALYSICMLDAVFPGDKERAEEEYWHGLECIATLLGGKDDTGRSNH
jgi:hypothetical protein